jgi:hypothetical protein
MTGEKQNSEILKVIEISDYYRYKTKEKLLPAKKNFEEIDIDIF